MSTQPAPPASGRPDLESTPIWQLVADFPHLKPILDRFGLDTCCGGDLTPRQAAAEHRLDAGPILEALQQAL